MLFCTVNTSNMQLRLSILAILASFSLFSQTDSSKHINLGTNVNSSVDEIGPVISADGKTLFYSRYSHKDNWAPYGKHDAWMSMLNPDGTWGMAQHIGKPINSTSRSGSVENVSTDNNQLIIRGAFEDGEFTGSGYSLLKLNKKGEWGEPEKIEIKNYKKYTLGAYTNVYLCKDGKTMILYFSESAKNDNGDLYVSHLVEREKWTKPKSFKDLSRFVNKALNNNTWTEPMKIGNVNTADYDETTPFLAADGKTLYFSSNRPGGYGNNDIWMAKRLDSTYTKWSEPVNLGKGVNTDGWDAYYTLDARGEYAYMVSKNGERGQDIVKVKLTEDIKPNPVVLIKGVVYNSKTKEPIGANIEYENLVDGKNAGMAISSSKNGEYTIVLPYGINYGFLAYNQGFISVSDNLDLTTVSAYKEITRDLYLTPLEVGTTVRLNNIFFDFGKATLRSESFPELDRLVELMGKNEKVQIEISGHTDNVGSDDANLKLSEERAKAVMDYVIAKGIDASRMVSKGYGETKPLATNDTDEGKQLNRRVEFTVNKN